METVAHLDTHVVVWLYAGEVSTLSFQRVVAAAVEQTWTRDPFDRLIVAQAQAEGASLVTADKLIRKHFARSVWGKIRR